jgi:phage gpG-like protein
MPLELTRQVGQMIVARGDVGHFKRLLDLRYTSMRDFQEPLRLWGIYLTEVYAPGQINAQGAPIEFAPLSPRYKRWKDQHYPGRSILVRTGAMQRGYTFRNTATRLTVDNSQSYWIYHQTGTRKMPARKVFQLTDEDYNLLRRMIKDHVLKTYGVTS